MSAQSSTTVGYAQITVSSPNVPALSPRNAALTLLQTQQFVATDPNGAAINWSVDGIPGGNASVGTISKNGLYSPPTVAGTHSVTATDTNGASNSATVAVTDLGGVYTFHNDLPRTGQNLQEYALTPTTG